MVYNWPSMIYRQFFTHPPIPTTDCTGKTIVVTGANIGLGKEAARHFVRLNAAKVIIASRSLPKGEAAKTEIETSENRPNVLEVWHLDLQSYDSVKAFATRCKTLSRIDAVVENAGIATAQYVSVGGNESTITVNVVSTFLLALLLLPILRQSAERFKITPHLSIVSSEMHFLAQLPEREESRILDSLNAPQTRTMARRYETSKLLEVLVCRELCRLRSVEEMGDVVVNFLCPGFCHSGLMREAEGALSMRILKGVLAKSTEEGSRTLVHAGVAAGRESHGKWLSACKVAACSDLVEGKEGLELQGRVWEELKEKLEAIEEGVTRGF